MTTTINASNSGGGGLVQTADASGVLALQTAGTTAVTIDASQNVGIGTASPSTKLDVNGNIALPNATALQFKDSGGSRKDTLQLNSSSNIILQSPSASIFQINGSTEAMRVDAGGNVGIGTSAPNAFGNRTFEVSAGANSAAYLILSTNSNTIRGEMAFDTGTMYVSTKTSHPLVFRTVDAERCRIDTSGNFTVSNGSIYFTSAQYRSNVASSQLQFINNSAGVSLAVNGTSWGSLSDERDKEIIEPIADAVNKVASLRSVIGRYKIDDADKRRAFLIAQDVKAVLPEAVTELEDEQQTLILQYTEVIPLLVAAINEQQALITSLTARIAALEGTPA
jgi:hypothetical protein